MYPHQLLGFFSLELRISATQGCISGGGRAVKWPAMTKPPEIPKQKTFSSLHKSTHVTPPSFTQTATALRVGELGSFCWEKPKQSKTKPQENSSAKVFGSRDWESGKWAQPEAREHSPAQWPSLKIPSIMKLSQQSQHTTPQPFLQASIPSAQIRATPLPGKELFIPRSSMLLSPSTFNYTVWAESEPEASIPRQAVFCPEPSWKCYSTVWNSNMIALLVWKHTSTSESLLLKYK